MAGDEFRIAVGGLKELRRDLRAIDKDMPRHVLLGAHRRIGAMVLPAARSLSPVGETGRLQRSHRVLASQRRAAVAAGTKRVFYAPMVFHGTGQRQTRNGANRGRVKANPWLYRALPLVGESRIVSAYDDQLAKLLDKHGMG